MMSEFEIWLLGAGLGIAAGQDYQAHPVRLRCAAALICVIAFISQQIRWRKNK